MTHRNPFVRMRWLQIRPRLTRHDIACFQERMRELYPELVIFPRRYHFHELGEETHRPEFIEDMISHFEPRLDPAAKFGYCVGEPVALRVPWPDDIASGNPQRLIGRPHRRPFSDSPEAFRRFGRTIYLDSGSSLCFTGETIRVEPSLLLPHSKPGTRMAPVSLLVDCDGCHIELPHDRDDPEVDSFVKASTRIINALTSTSVCYYDLVTGEALFIKRTQPTSRSFLKRCAVEPRLYLSLGHGTVNGHPFAIGPTPAQIRRWRREAGLGDDPRLQNPPSLSGPELNRFNQDQVARFPESVFKQFPQSEQEAFFDYMRRRSDTDHAAPVES